MHTENYLTCLCLTVRPDPILVRIKRNKKKPLAQCLAQPEVSTEVSFYCYYEAPVLVYRPEQPYPLPELPLIPRLSGETDGAPPRMRADSSLSVLIMNFQANQKDCESSSRGTETRSTACFFSAWATSPPELMLAR